MTSTGLSLRTIILTVFTIMLIIAGMPVGAGAQAQPGRILTAPSDNNIIECNLDASDCFNVVGYSEGNINQAAPNSPSIANDGTIAFTAVTGPDGTVYNTPNVYFANADGTNVRQLTSFNAGQNAGNLYPAISPDATMAAFITNVNTTPGGSRPQQIYLVNADGSNFRQLTPFDTTGPDPSQSYFDGMAWSPDSKKLALRGVVYTSTCGTYEGSPIYVRIIGAINADGTGFQILACDNNDSVNSIDWSPDGTLLAWTRNVQHGAQGCSGCVGEPAIAFLDFSGQNRYSSGITSTQLSGASGGDSCGDTACIHFSPDSTMLAYKDTFRDGIYCYGGPCYISTIDLDGTNKTETSIPVSGEMWWMGGPAIPAPASMTLAPTTLELWPGFSLQLTPSLLDGGGNLILHTANVFNTSYAYAPICILQIGPYGLTTVTMTNNYGGSNTATVSASNAGLTSATVPVKCWYSPPCTYSLASSSDNFDQNGGSGSVGVTADPGQNASTCPWQATSNASWIIVTSPALGNGAGNGNVAFTVAANNTGQARQGTITINPAGTFTVDQSAVSTVTLQSITVSPNPASVAAGLTQQFTATGHYSDGSTQNLTASVTWSSSDTAVATISNMAGSNGLASGVAQGGPVTITATQNSISGTAQLTVTAPVLQSVTVSPTSASVPAGLTQQFSATGHYSDGSSGDITASATWSSSNTGIATISNTAGSQGLARGVAPGGPVTITATLNSISGTAQLTVTAPVLSSIAITPANPSVPAGGMQAFTATGTYSDGSQQNLTASVTWSSSNTGVATINSSGVATAVAQGSTTIGALLNGTSGSTTMNVITLQSITLAPLSASTFVGSTVQYSATGHYSDGSTLDLTASAAWTSSKMSVATITSPGALATGVGKGTTNITANVGGVSASTTLMVIAVAVQTITVTPANTTLAVGQMQQYTAVATYNNGTMADVTSSASWATSPKKLASISSTGLLTASKPGTDKVTAKLGGVSGSTTLTITP
jgi:uncharacterized protein YjdB